MTNLPNELKEEFFRKFNHFNSLYIGRIHEEPELADNPDLGKQICDDVCENNYDLDDVWDWITTHFLKTKICEICGVQVSPYDHFCHGSKPYSHDYIKNNQDIIAGREK